MVGFPMKQKQVIIENPILNSPFEMPKRHYKSEKDGVTDEIVETRRKSSYFIPVASPRKTTRQGTLFSLADDHIHQVYDEINEIRSRVDLWRDQEHPGITPTTRQLLEYWARSSRNRRLFFCQLEAVETIIYLTECADKSNDAFLVHRLKQHNQDAGTPLFRIACKMATGSGKTVVMAMLIVWNILNRRANPRSKHYADSFLLVAPGITIRDRLRVLLPSDPANYYDALDLVPPEHRDNLGAAKIVITNYHAFQCKETGDAARLTKAILTRGTGDAFTETPAQMVRRVCREFGSKKNIIVINDEAHHCYRSKPSESDDKLTGDDKKEAQEREEAARLWINGLEAVQKHVGIRQVYDLSATPFYLKGSGYSEGTLFPWVVSDFSLIDAIESGIVKIPRLPVADDAMIGDFPKYRYFWPDIRDSLPKKGRGTDQLTGPPNVPILLASALQSLYGHYRKQHEAWQEDAVALADGRTPPVFIVVCNNTNVSKLVFDHIAGFETEAKHPDGTPIVAPGNLPLFSNEENGRWRHRPNTILVDSEQLESEEGLSPEFKKLASPEIDEFKAELKRRFPGRDVDTITDQDLLREVLNTVGKAGKLGEHIKCVVSVSMLTEGWDAQTVTHILGIRAFGTQLLCEQVVGRGLRRTTYTLNEKGHFDPEYADVYGIPYAFLNCPDPKEAKEKKEPRPKPGRIRALPERLIQNPHLEITYPRLTGYRYEMPPTQLQAKFTESSRVVLSTADIPLTTENAPIVGETVFHTLDDLRKRRPQEIAYMIAKYTLEKYFRAEDGDGVQVWLFPQIVTIVKSWLDSQVVCKDNTFPQLLLFTQKANEAAEKIHRAIAAASSGEQRLRALLQPYDTVGSTSFVSFDSTKVTYRTTPTKCHISHVVCDSNWEAKFAQTLEFMDEVKAYAKNQSLGFKIPYTFEGQPRNYYPDYLLRIDDGHGLADLLNLIVEITGQDLKEKEAKTSTMRSLWIPAVNNEGRFGRWDFLEIRDPWNAQTLLREYLSHRVVG
jgi:type III restriction enzyme